jgi:hypothetical protein
MKEREHPKAKTKQQKIDWLKNNLSQEEKAKRML